jgi:hypothetical protein
MEAHHIVQKPYPKGGCMDEVSAQATLTDAEVDPRLAVSVPKSEIERALEAKDDVDLLLDVIRTNGEREERRVSLAWDRDALERLAQQEGERVIIAIDPDSLQAAFDDVEGHGMREMGATLAIVVAAAAGGAGAAGAVISPTSGSPSGSPAVEATVDTSGWQAEAEASGYGVRGTPSDVAVDTSGWQAEAEASGYGVRGTPSDVAADSTAGIENVRAGQAAPEAVSDTAAGIENVRAGREAPAAAPDPSSAIENVRSGGSAVPDTAAGIENVRAERTAPGVGGSGGTSISAPSPAVSAALAGGVVLTIAGAAFALRRRREPEIA